MNDHATNPHPEDAVAGRVRFSPTKTAWLATMLIGAMVGGSLTATPRAVALFVVTTATVLLLGHSLGSHRKLIHESFQCPRWLEVLLVWMGVQVGLAGPIGLARQHDLRDWAQRQPDCHPYLRHGTGAWRDAWWQLCCELRHDDEPYLAIGERLERDPVYRFLERTWMLQVIGPGLLFFAWGGWSFVFWGVCARVSAGVIGHWAIGHLAHNHGDLHHRVNGAAVQGRNVRFASLLTMGESWHNNAFPGSARLGLYAGEWDPGWWVLLALRACGLVRDLHLPWDLAHRSELERCAGIPPLVRPVSTPAFEGRLCLAACLAPDTLRSHGRARLEGPAANLSASFFRGRRGNPIPFFEDRRATRLLLALGDGRTIVGLPALCVVLSLRGRIMQGIALTLLPLAIAAEKMRRQLSIDPATA